MRTAHKVTTANTLEEVVKLAEVAQYHYNGASHITYSVFFVLAATHVPVEFQTPPGLFYSTPPGLSQLHREFYPHSTGYLANSTGSPPGKPQSPPGLHRDFRGVVQINLDYWRYIWYNVVDLALEADGNHHKASVHDSSQLFGLPAR